MQLTGEPGQDVDLWLARKRGQNLLRLSTEKWSATTDWQESLYLLRREQRLQNALVSIPEIERLSSEQQASLLEVVPITFSCRQKAPVHHIPQWKSPCRNPLRNPAKRPGGSTSPESG